MKPGRWLKSILQSDSTDERPSESPASSKAPAGNTNAHARTVDAIAEILKRPENAELRGDILLYTLHLDSSFAVDKLQKIMREQITRENLASNGREFSEALREAVKEIQKTAPPADEEDGLMDVVLESAGDKKMVIIQVLRRMMSGDLKGVMDAVNDVPAVIMSGVSPSKAAAAQKILTESGAQVSLRPSGE